MTETMSIPTVAITCCHTDCGISFAVPDWWHRGRRETHASFYCPNGHKQSFPAETEMDRVKRERDIAKQQIERAEQEAAAALRLRDTERRLKEKAEKEMRQLKKRASAGTCPCCQRTFSNMARHMKDKHPAFNVIPLVQKGAKE